MEGGPSLADIEFTVDEKEAAVNKPAEEEAKIAQAVDEIFKETKTSQKTTRESLEASDAGFWMNEYYKKAKRDPMRTDVIKFDELENAAFIAQNYLTALIEKVNNPNVRISMPSTKDEANMKQLARNIIAEWNLEKKRPEEKEARHLRKAA